MPRARKLLLSVHLTVSVGWMGAVMAYLALGLGAVTSSQTEVIRAAWTGMELIGWYVIVPLAIASLVTGLGMALGTRWGLFRYYWVSISFFLTSLATVVLLLHMPTVTATAAVAQRARKDELEALGGDLFHPALGLVVLIVVQVLNIYKPAGMTRYGWRKKAQMSSGG